MVMARWGGKGYVVLEGKKNNTLVDSWNSSPADQDGADFLWSTSYETSFQSIIKNDITKDKTDIRQERQKISQAYAIAKDNGDINS